MTIEITAISKPNEIRIFNALPKVIYRKSFIAPSLPQYSHTNRQFMEQLFSRVEAQPFLAYQRGRPVGRIVASIHHAYPNQETGFFGYFESLPDPAIAAALLQTAKQWLTEKGKSTLIGPIDLTPHERLGLLFEGFSGRHLPGMPYNPPYYITLLTRCGLQEEMILRAYHCDTQQKLPDKLCRVAARAWRGTQQLRLREIDFQNLPGEGEILSRLHNQSFVDTWGFVPLSAEEGASIWKKLRGICDPSLILIAELEGEPAGICLIIHPMARKAFFSRALGHSRARLAILAVSPQYRLRGIEAALISECFQRARDKGISVLELSQIAENNAMMHHIIRTLGNVPSDRSYTVYQAAINDAI